MGLTILIVVLAIVIVFLAFGFGIFVGGWLFAARVPRTLRLIETKINPDFTETFTVRGVQYPDMGEAWIAAWRLGTKETSRGNR